MSLRDDQPCGDDDDDDVVYCGTFRASEHFEEDSNWDVSKSILDLEKMRGISYITSSLEFDNTLEAVEYICNITPKTDKKSKACKDAETKKLYTEMEKMSAQGNTGKLALNLKTSAIVTPMEEEKKEKEIFATSSVLQSKPSTSSLKKTPSKNPAFQHVVSPVAYYINNSPQNPLIRNVHPKKTLPGLLSIPEPVKTTGFKPSNKEYVDLPNVAYKSAKKTTVIDVSNAPKMPQSQWAKKLTESIPTPAVIKHTHREFINKPSQREPEDSFDDLSLHQADISVCIKKNAF